MIWKIFQRNLNNINHKTKDIYSGIFCLSEGKNVYLYVI